MSSCEKVTHCSCYYASCENIFGRYFQKMNCDVLRWCLECPEHVAKSNWTFHEVCPTSTSDVELRKVTHCSCYYASCENIFGRYFQKMNCYVLRWCLECPEHVAKSNWRSTKVCPTSTLPMLSCEKWPTVVVIMQVVKISSDVIFKKWIVMFLDDA